jgi:hypothetical protein
MKYAVGMDSVVMTYISSFIKICLGFQKMGKHTQTAG